MSEESSQRVSQSLHAVTVAGIVAAGLSGETGRVLEQQMAKRRSGIRNHAAVEGYYVE